MNASVRKLEPLTVIFQLKLLEEQCYLTLKRHYSEHKAS